MNVTPFDQASIDCLTAPVRVPSGRWADFNPVRMYWNGLTTLVHDGYIPADQLPPEPNPADYPNTSLPRSSIWEDLPDNGFPMITTISRV